MSQHLFKSMLTRTRKQNHTPFNPKVIPLWISYNIIRIEVINFKCYSSNAIQEMS